MWNNKNDQLQQCFLDQEIQQHCYKAQIQKTQIQYAINNQLPANQLRSFSRPTNLYPRTIFLYRNFTLLPPQLNQTYIQKVESSIQGKLKLKIVNSKNLTVQEYFSKSKFKCIYNKLEGISNQKKSYLGKLKGIDQLIDYNQKCFKQLQQPQSLTNIKPITQDQLDSDFQCGNLCKAFINKEQQHQYYLMIQNDINTYGYNNWFFFRYKNISKGNRRFSIVNMIKKSLFYNQGMLISIFSRKRCDESKGTIGWFKGGNKITYTNINFIRDHHYNDYYYCLSFQYQFQYEEDQVYFAINQPYTYTRLANFLKQIQSIIQSNKLQEQGKDKNGNIDIQVKIVGYSISNNIIPAIRYSSQYNKNKQIIFIVARQHPCQTVGSFIIQSIIKQLMNQQDPIVSFLLKTFQIIIVPMANPDGVIHGNSRCNMAGLDINRQWGQDAIKQLNPQTVKIKSFLNSLYNKKSIKYMIDLHGHGKKLNSFFFSCKSDLKQNMMKLMSMSMKKLETRFNIYGCTYGITKDKQNTIRAKANNMGISNSYTLQTSLYGWKTPMNQILHFNQSDYSHIASNLLKSIFLLEAKPSETQKYLHITKQQLLIEMQTLDHFTQKDEQINLKNNDILSQSDPQGDQLDVKQMISKCQNKGIKKKLQENLKKRKSKKVMSQNSCLISDKNIKKSIPVNLQINNTKITSSSISMQNNETKLSKLQSRLQTKHKKISFTQKWKEKRQKIVQMKKKSQIRQNKDRPKMMTQTSFKFNNIRSKIKTQLSETNDRSHPVIVPVASKTFYQKKKLYNVKMKTQFQEVDAFNKTNTHQQIQKNKDNYNRKSALQLKFKQLKQQSLNILFINTLSGNKITSKQKEKVNEQIIPKKEQKKIKNRLNNQIFSQPHMNRKQPQTLDHYLGPYNKFKKFINKGNSNKKIQKNHNSVFYYFPVL